MNKGTKGIELLSKIAIALEILGDGRWHQMEELALSLDLNEYKLRELTSFLTAYNFIKVDEKKGRVKINNTFEKLSNRLINV